MIDRTIGRVRSVAHTARLQPRRRGSRRFGYLHIAKTGGTSTNALIGRLQYEGHRTPTVLGHGWTITDIGRRYPRMRLAVVVRDPLERTISAFNSRQVAGPQGVATWSPEEAAAFALFPTVDQFLAACISDVASDRAAAQYALRSIAHLRDGYVHHFGRAEAAEKALERVDCVGTMADLDTFHCRMFRSLDVPEELVMKHTTVEHRSPVPTTSWTDRLTATDQAALRDFLAAEYAVYDRLIERLPAAQHAPPAS